MFCRHYIPPKRFKVKKLIQSPSAQGQCFGSGHYRHGTRATIFCRLQHPTPPSPTSLYQAPDLPWNLPSARPRCRIVKRRTTYPLTYPLRCPIHQSISLHAATCNLSGVSDSSKLSRSHIQEWNGIILVLFTFLCGPAGKDYFRDQGWLCSTAGSLRPLSTGLQLEANSSLQP